MIESFPWLSLVDVRVPKDGEWAIIHSSVGHAQAIQASGMRCVYPLVKPNNAYNVLRLEDLKIPEGYETDGETLKDAFRVPTGVYLTDNGKDLLDADEDPPYGPDKRRLCLRRIAPKTKRVLVVEYDNPPKVLLDHFHDVYTFGCKAVTRIEERPL